MHTCEVYSVRKSKADYAELAANFDLLNTALAEQGVIAQHMTDVAADPKKLCAAVNSSQDEDAAQICLFANALNTTDSSSFKRLFYELIAELESKLTADEEHEGMIPKLKIFSLGDLGGGYKGYCFRAEGRIFIVAPYASLTGLNAVDLLCTAVETAVEVLSSKREEYPGGVAYVPASKAAVKAAHQKEPFLRSFIPHKGDRGRDVVRKVVVLVAIAAFIVSAGYLISVVTAGMENDISNTKIQQIAHPDGSGTGETTSDGEPLPSEDWDALKAINDEIVGWVELKGTPINYPVLLHEGDDENYQYYIDHTYEKERSNYGSIFVDYRSTEGVNSKNVTLHGHNMLNGSMFHELVNYAESHSFTPKLDYYKEHAVISFNTPEGDSQWKVISVFKTNTYFIHGEFFNYMQGSFNSDAEFMNFVYNVRIRSMFNTPVTVNENDRLLTLSTCSYEFTGFRTVVVARKVRPDEDPNVDVELATVNSSPLYPNIYYTTFGGYRPNPLTFKTAYEMGSISWYDGKGNLEGSEDLTGTIASNPLPGYHMDGTPIYSYYIVTYRNYDDSQIAAYTVRKGDPVPIPDVVPSYEDDKYIYKFVKWNTDIEGVDFGALNANITIYPIYEFIRKDSVTTPIEANTP